MTTSSSAPSGKIGLPGTIDRLCVARRVDAAAGLVAGWSIPLALIFACLQQFSVGALHWSQVLALLLASASSWGQQRGLRIWPRVIVPVAGTVWVLIFALATTDQPVEVALLFTTAIAAAAYVLPPVAVAFSGATNGALYAAVAVIHQPLMPVSQMLLPAALMGLLGLGLALFVAQNKARYHELAQNITILKRQIFEQSILLEINRSVHNLQAQNTLQTLVEVTTQVMGTERTALLVADSHKHLKLSESVFSSRYVPGRGDPAHLTLSQDTFASVLTTDRPVFVKGSPEQGRKDKAILAIPLRGPEGPIGVLAFDHDMTVPVGPNDEELLKDLAEISVLVIENRRLHARIQRLADHDGLTDIYNHRYFQESLRAELASAVAERRPLAVLMLEVDKFKAYNDRYGHQRGDSVLQSIATVLDRSAQAWHGIAARYGGDEFVVILPGQNRSSAISLARQLLDEIARGTAATVEPLGLPPVTVSMGLATFPENGFDAPALIEAADQAMYRAKQQGGDHFCSSPV